MNSELNRYYLYGIFPALIIFFIITGVSGLIEAAFYMLGFVWPYSFYTPGLSDKLDQRNHRFSFLGLSKSIHLYLFTKITHHKMAPVVRLICPLFFVGCLSIISLSPIYLWTFVGWFLFEIFFLCNSRFSLKLF